MERLERLVQRRVAGEPLQYVLGFTEFCGLRLAVSPEVLIPRPETEGLVEAAATCLRQRGSAVPWRILEVGVGSGNIAISLAHALPSCAIVGIELSWKALRVARANARMCGVADQMRWIQGDWTGAVRGAFDVVISNPPYIPTDELHRVRADSEIGREPWLSLDGGVDGMAYHRRLLADAPRLLTRGGTLCMECAESQARPLAEEARRAPWVKGMRVLDDLAGRPRGLWIESWTH